MTVDMSTIDPNGPLGYLVDKPKPKGPDNTLGKDAFLKLLVAQMKYQNPMEPADSTEFISQTAQFTLVEKMESMAADNAELLASQRNATAAALVGSQVKWEPQDGDDPEAPTEGVVEGVRITADGPILVVDGWEIALSRVTAMKRPDATTPTDGTDGTDETDDTSDGEGTTAVSETDPTGTDAPVTDTSETTDVVEDTSPTDGTEEPAGDSQPDPEAAPAA